ncbi:hypothetical protein EX895_004369 [Sporisorium graminicola]|uniref:Sec39 domain-containing protein n=1 Tax=Sporisorium graminicola TaxID=280036 RepID=A0A4V6ETI1_9BASI|nr:hypothetical protein EX895_004369 [Sporisorium graminicola]TKY86729.1 hypothetical protein EX895_004369 [Sporisorium graminicola]
MSGSSSGASMASPPRKAKPASDVRQTQRRWVQLIDEWHSRTEATPSSRDELVEQITHHAELLCRTVKDRVWLLDAFHLAIDAVLFPSRLPEVDDESAELSRIETLGQWLLQQANREVALPRLRELQETHAEPAQVEAAKAQLEEWVQLSRRLATYERLRGMQSMLGLPPLPMPLVLQQSTPTLLLCLASLPHAATILGQLLRGNPSLEDDSAPARLAILKQLLVGAGSREHYAQLAEYGLLIGWKNGHEFCVWANPARGNEVQLDELITFYSDILEQLRETGGVEQAEALQGVLATVWHGEDAKQALERLRTSAATPLTSAPTFTAPKATVQRFDLATVQSIATQLSPTSNDNNARQQLAQQLLASRGADETVQRVIQLVDTHDSLAVRRFALDVASHAHSVPLIAALLYARPAVGHFRLDLSAPATLLDHAETVLAQLDKTERKSGQGEGAGLSDALRSALDLDPHSIVPACQVQLITGAGDGDVLMQARLHVSWLRAVKALVEAQTEKPVLDLCWLAAYAGNGSSGQDKQMSAFDELLASFDSAHPPPGSIGGRPDRAQDPALLKFRATWVAFFHSCLELTGGETVPFAHVGKALAVEKLLSQVLRTGDVELFRSLSYSSSATGALSPSKLEQLVLDVSTLLFDQATVASTRSKDIRLSLEVLSALPGDSARARSQRDFIEAACRLSSFKIKSIVHPGQPMEPKEIRATTDKMDLVARLLATQGDAHRSPELVLDVANRLCGIHLPATAAASASADRVSDKTLVEARTLAMLADASTAAEDFEDAASFCQRLVDRVAAVRSRVATSPSAAEIVEIAWKTCFQLSKHPLWEDTPSRISMLAHAMTLCPPTQLNGMLRQWQTLDQQLLAEIEAGKEFASTKTAAAGGMGWLGSGPGGRGGVGDYISAQTAASVGAGLVGTAANLLPLSFSPLSYFGNSATGTGTGIGNPGAPRATAAGGAGTTTETQEPNVDARTARLFDFDNVSGASSGGSGFVDPTERAVRAARAARDFLGWKSDQRQLNAEGGDNAQQQLQPSAGGAMGGGFSFSRGVGWLIGDGESR